MPSPEEGETLDEFADKEEALGYSLVDHAGEWVAIEHHEIVASAHSLNELMQEQFDHQAAEVFRVASPPQVDKSTHGGSYQDP